MRNWEGLSKRPRLPSAIGRQSIFSLSVGRDATFAGVWGLTMYTRIFNHLYVVRLLSSVACNQDSTWSGQRLYNHLLFIRQGGGDKAFTIEPTESPDTVFAVASRHQFRDTLVRFRCVRDANTTVSLNAFNRALDWPKSRCAASKWKKIRRSRDKQNYHVSHKRDRKQQTLHDEASVVLCPELDTEHRSRSAWVKCEGRYQRM